MPDRFFKKENMSMSEFPNAIDHDSRICFGDQSFATEAEADAAHKFVRKRGDY